MKPVQMALTVLGAGGVILLFLPFAYGVVPVRDASVNILVMGALPGIVLPAAAMFAFSWRYG